MIARTRSIADIRNERAQQENAPGYGGNGVSEFTRGAARGTAYNGPGARLYPTMTQPEWQLAFERRRLAKLEARMMHTTDPERSGKLARDHEAKLKFIARLESEVQDALTKAELKNESQS